MPSGRKPRPTSNCSSGVGPTGLASQLVSSGTRPSSAARLCTDAIAASRFSGEARRGEAVALLELRFLQAAAEDVPLGEPQTATVRAGAAHLTLAANPVFIQ
jgi:hypothetical protein